MAKERVENETGTTNQKPGPVAAIVRYAAKQKEWVKVQSHVDLEGNERADELADEGEAWLRRLAAEGKKKRR